jgi:hypothetical protein
MKPLWLVFILLASLAAAAEKEAAPRKPFGGYAWELSRAALQESKGQITDDQFRRIATALFKYLEGDPSAREKLVVSIRPFVEDKEKIIVFVSYDYGSGFRGYEFAFGRKWGVLTSVAPVPSE